MRTRKPTLLAFLLILVAGIAIAQTTGTGNQRVTPSYELTIASNVRGADIFINGELQRERTPATLTLRRGTYDIRVEARGYRQWSQTVTLTRDTRVFAELTPPFATIVQRVPDEYLNYRTRNPANQISIYVDGQLRNESRIQVPEGWHDVAIASGGLRIENEFYLEAGATYTLELILRMNILRGGY